MPSHAVILTVTDQKIRIIQKILNNQPYMLPSYMPICVINGHFSSYLII